MTQPTQMHHDVPPLRQPDGRLTPAEGYVRWAALRYDVEPEQIQAPPSRGSGHPKVHEARAFAAAMLHGAGRWSLSEVGAILGGRDHSTVIYLIRRYHREASRARSS